MQGFQFYSAGRLVFGRGELARLAELLPAGMARPLLVVGGRSADESGLTERLRAMVSVAAVARCQREPRVEDVERVVREARAGGCDSVLAVGGGAVLDCGKAVAALLTNTEPLVDYLEGVGRGLSLEQPPRPMVAVPTTAGTGSEVTKNAVISGEGFKKSLRSPMMIPDLALVDPELTLGAPPAVTAACGMDALTQLLEAYLSRSASPLTDGLALEGLRCAGAGLQRAVEQPADLEAREQMALASLCGGLCLANAGLGAVHGFASPLGALLPMGHGVACAALLPHVVRANLRAAQGTARARLEQRLTRVAHALCDADPAPADAAVATLLEFLERLQRELQIPRLSALGLTEELVPQIVAGARGSSMRYNPVELSDEQLQQILRAAW